MIGALKDRPKASSTDRGDFVVFVVATTEAIFASAIEIMLIRHVFTETILCCIFESL